MRSWRLSTCSTSTTRGCRASYSPTSRHHLVVDVEQFDKRQLRTWLESRVSSVQAKTWREIGERLGRLGYWEFEDYQPE